MRHNVLRGLALPSIIKAAKRSYFWTDQESWIKTENVASFRLLPATATNKIECQYPTLLRKVFEVEDAFS